MFYENDSQKCNPPNHCIGYTTIERVDIFKLFGVGCRNNI